MKSRFRNWQDVRVFLAVMRQGSTLAASKALEVSQPTVARRIDVLEHETGLTLFVRDTRGFRPTAAAEALLPVAEEMERLARRLAVTAEALVRDRSQPIRITAATPNFNATFANILSDFSELHPEVRFDMNPTYKTLDLMAGEADIALRLTANPPHPDLIGRKISDAQFTLFASRRYIAAYGAPKSPEDLAGHKFVAFRHDNLSPRHHDWLQKRVSAEQFVTVTENVDAMMMAIRAGHGVGIVNVALAREYKDLVQCCPPPEELNVPHMLLISPQAWIRPEVKDFVAFFAPRYTAVFRREGSGKAG
jgi:DNA-binding transcriptional LysR family regulator